MRIAVVETNAHGGLLHYSVQLADALAERGHDVDLLLPRGHELVGHASAATLRPVLTPHVRPGSHGPRGRVRQQLRRGTVALRLGWSLGRSVVEVRRGRYDVALLHWDLMLGLVGGVTTFLQALPGRPRLAYLLHNVRPFNRWGGDDLFLSQRVTERLGQVLSRFDLVLVHGERSREEYARLYPPARVAVVPHGDERIFGKEPPPPSDEERVLFFGDWRKVKGLPVLMEAFDLLAERRPHARLTVTGTPAPADFDDRLLRRWAEDRPGRVELQGGYVPVEQVRDVFAAARVVCTPYLVGFQSGVVHLAMSMGRAVVTSDVGDLADAVGRDVGGLVVPAGDAHALADALERILADPALAAALGAAGHARSQSASSWEAAAEQFERAFTEALQPAPAA